MGHDKPGDLRYFIREITRRIQHAVERLDRAVDVMDRKTDVLAEKTELLAEEMRLQFAQQREYLDDILAENRAQREALFRILDRLDNGGTAPAA
jgi:hypothetical protein